MKYGNNINNNTDGFYRKKKTYVFAGRRRKSTGQ